MDTQTRHALKGDKFAQATKTSVTWLSGHRSGVVRLVISAVVVVVLLVGGLVFWNLRSSAADTSARMWRSQSPFDHPGWRAW